MDAIPNVLCQQKMVTAYVTVNASARTRAPIRMSPAYVNVSAIAVKYRPKTVSAYVNASVSANARVQIRIRPAYVNASVFVNATDQQKKVFAYADVNASANAIHQPNASSTNLNIRRTFERNL